MNEDNFPKTYYFTFGISGNHAFNGGWVKVIATGKASAIQTFLKAYPRAARDFLRVSFMPSAIVSVATHGGKTAVRVYGKY